MSPTPAPPLHGMSVEEIEEAIKKHWMYADFYLAEILAGESTIEETARDLQGLIHAANAEREST